MWAETKYDGERAQIHVKVRADGGSDITIFSKSRRESTGDRVAVHDIIRAALGLRLAKASAGSSRPSPSQPPKVKHTIILDAEMVAFCGDKIAGKLSSLPPRPAIEHRPQNFTIYRR